MKNNLTRREFFRTGAAGAVAVARKLKPPVMEEACQAWLAEHRGKKSGTIGDLGCFSFQESKHIHPANAARSRA